MNTPIPEDLQQIIDELEAAGWNPRLCDTRVPFIYASVMVAEE